MRETRAQVLRLVAAAAIVAGAALGRGAGLSAAAAGGSRVDWKAIIDADAGAAPQDLDAHLRLAVAYANLGMIREAALEFRVIGSARYDEFGREVIAERERVVAGAPDDILSLNMLAFAYYAFEDYEKSVGCFERLVRLDPQNVWIRHYYALSLSKVNRLDQAIEVLKAALEQDPSNDYSHLLLALAYKEKGWYVLSVLELARAGGAVRELAKLR